MSKPRLLDVFSGAGGAAKGYQRAGFYVVGVDILDQPNYCGDEFVQMDAMQLLAVDGWYGFDAIHASPPCPHYANVTKWRGNPAGHPALIEPVREALIRSGKPYVIENVRTPALRGPLVLCGSQFGLPIRRHRYFESNVPLFGLMPPCQHRKSDLPFMHKNERAYADALGCPWMTAREGRDAIPPAYTEWIGQRLLERIEVAA